MRGVRFPRLLPEQTGEIMFDSYRKEAMFSPTPSVSVSDADIAEEGRLIREANAKASEDTT